MASADIKLQANIILSLTVEEAFELKRLTQNKITAMDDDIRSSIFEALPEFSVLHKYSTAK